MSSFASLFVLAATVLPAIAVPATSSDSFITYPVTKRSRWESFPIQDVVAKDRSRLDHYNHRFSHGSRVLEERYTTGLAINEDVSYVVQTKVGNQTFSLIVDTGSSNTWIGAGTKFNGKGTNTKATCSVSYGSGTMSGTEWTSSVAYGGVTVAQQSICNASKTSGFSGVDGIIGFGPVGLTQSTVSGQSTVPTWMDNLKSHGTISTEVLGVYFRPESGSNRADANGELDIGGVNTAKYTGTLTYFPKSTTSPYSYYWGLNTASLKYGTTTLATSASAIVDTGTTLIYIPTAAYNKFLTASGGKTDSSSGLAHWTTAPTSTFTITVGSVGYTLTPAQYLVPKAQYSYFGLTSGYYSWIDDGGSSASSVNFIIGQKFLENYYSVFDTSNSRIGFATRS